LRVGARKPKGEAIPDGPNDEFYQFLILSKAVEDSKPQYRRFLFACYEKEFNTYPPQHLLLSHIHLVIGYKLIIDGHKRAGKKPGKKVLSGYRLSKWLQEDIEAEKKFSYANRSFFDKERGEGKEKQKSGPKSGIKKKIVKRARPNIRLKKKGQDPINNLPLPLKIAQLIKEQTFKDFEIIEYISAQFGKNVSLGYVEHIRKKLNRGAFAGKGLQSPKKKYTEVRRKRKLKEQI